MRDGVGYQREERAGTGRYDASRVPPDDEAQHVWEERREEAPDALMAAQLEVLVLLQGSACKADDEEQEEEASGAALNGLPRRLFWAPAPYSEC